MKITCITVGKIKEKFMTDAINEYAKRLSRYCKLDIIELADEKTPDNASAVEEENIKNKEGERILAKIKDGAYVISLAIEGKQLDSVELSQKINDLGVNGTSHIVFIIGGSLGLSDAVKIISYIFLKGKCLKCKEKISFSPMTFPHQLMRVILLEQVYRGFRIANNEPYHK